MNETEPSPAHPSEGHAWPSLRIVLVCLGVLALAASAAGVYYSTHPASQAGPASSAGAFAFPVHDAPRPVTEIAFEDGAGRKRTLAEFRGRTLLLNVWATWCVPCREEMPALDRLQQKLGGPGFEVLALSIDTGGAAAVKSFYDEIGIRALAIYVDSSMRANDKLRVVGVPTTLLIDREGREVGRRTGPATWDGPEAQALIRRYMETAAQGSK